MASKLFLTLTDKPFRCESCGRKFTYEPHLTADGYWLCDVCGKEVEKLNRSSRHSEI
jgi:ribosomal protein L37AE/L43A